MAHLTHSSPVIIVGAGTWGCATALQLARRGYNSVTVFDSHPLPSAIAAGNDINKIMEEGAPSDSDTDEEYAMNRIQQLATNAWTKDSAYREYYHPTGFVLAACSDDAYEHVKSYIAGHEDEFVALETADEFRGTMPRGVLTGDFPNWRGFWRQKGAGWVEARKTILRVHKEAIRLGVKFVTGSYQGKVESLLFDQGRTDVLGVKTVDGRVWYANHTILAAGANSDLFLDFKKQLRPTAWTLAHVPMTEEEADRYKDLPVLFNADRGFFIEPDLERHELKVCDEHPGYCNFVCENGGMRSRPFSRQQIPLEAAERMRRLLRETMPQIAERDFTTARICWDADTADRLFLIDRHPEYKSLVVAVGGSGHGFMMMPAAGILISDALEEVMEPRLKRALRWRPETAVNRDWWDTQDRYGADGEVMDFHNVREWTRVGQTEDIKW